MNMVDTKEAHLLQAVLFNMFFNFCFVWQYRWHTTAETMARTWPPQQEQKTPLQLSRKTYQNPQLAPNFCYPFPWHSTPKWDLMVHINLLWLNKSKWGMCLKTGQNQDKFVFHFKYSVLCPLCSMMSMKLLFHDVDEITCFLLITLMWPFKIFLWIFFTLENHH